MSKDGDRTTDAGWDGAFPTTHWTEILEAGSAHEPRRQAALEDLLGRYWKPVYYYLRCKGYAREGAKDLTQGFFHEVVLGRSLIQKADRTKGRFRTFLLKALDRYVTSVYRAEKRKRRAPEGGLVSLERMDWLNVPEPVHYATPVEAFDYAWASALLDQVLAEVRRECRETGKAGHWGLFRARVLQPIMDDAEPPSRAELCERYRISSPSKASNMIVTVKRLFHAALRHHLRCFVVSDAEVDEEIHHLLKIFSRSGARS